MLLTELEDMPPIPLDQEGMHQVTHNIVLNAIEAVDGKTGRVNVRTCYNQQDDQVVLSVTDNGPGIPAKELDDIFKAFHSTKGHGGTGLGLAAARKIVSELGGEIEVQSEVGEGTTFHVKLPIRGGSPTESDS